MIRDQRTQAPARAKILPKLWGSVAPAAKVRDTEHFLVRKCRTSVYGVCFVILRGMVSVCLNVFDSKLSERIERTQQGVEHIQTRT